MEPWWDESFSNTLGAIAGAVIGPVFGGIGGGVGGPLAGRGKAKRFVLGMFWSGAILGALLLLTAAIAGALGQPSHVWIWMLLCGGILGFVCGGLLPVMHHVYRVAEERKLAAEELRRA